MSNAALSERTEVPLSAEFEQIFREHSGLVASLRKPLQQQALFEAIDRAIGGSRGAG